MWINKNLYTGAQNIAKKKNCFYINSLAEAKKKKRNKRKKQQFFIANSY